MEELIRKILNFMALSAVLAFLLTGFYKGSFQKYIQSSADILNHSNLYLNEDMGVQSQQNQSAISGAASKVSSSVVSVNVMESNYGYVPQFFSSTGSSVMPSPSAQKVAAGTGFFITSDGYILTNNHVVEDPGAYFTVTLPNSGTVLPASIAYKDPVDDLAIIKISGSGYAPVTLGDSSQIKIGETVAGIGNAFGKFSGTVSTGAISGLSKDIIASGPDSDEELHGLIQTDANLYPGDSGGPLLDASGKVIGVDVAIDQQAQQSFSIPANVAKNFIFRSGISI